MEPVTHPEPEGKGSTIYQIAEEAGVSVATVSRTINNSGYVSGQTRERIQRAMEAFKYEPNSLARSLTTKQTGMLALLLTDIANPFSAEIARGVQDVARDAGYVPIICSIDSDPTLERETVRTLRRKRVDGLILTPLQGERPHENERLLHTLCDHGMAMVCIGQPPVHPRADVVTTNTASGARAATGHLATLGHRSIAFIGGAFSRGVAVGRLSGYRQGLAEAGIPVDEGLIREGNLDEDSGRRQTAALLAMADPPTGIVCVNDRTAFGALAAIAEAGRRAPDDVSVVGFDDIPLASLIQPPLTTVRQPARQLGRMAAELLLHRVMHSDIPNQRRVLDCRLVVRKSSGPAPGT